MFPAWLNAIVELRTTRLPPPKFRIPPESEPPMFAALLSIRLRSIVIVPPVLAMPPPLDALPPVTRTRSSDSAPELRIRPPAKKAGLLTWGLARPPARLTPVIEAVTPAGTSNTRKALTLPCTVVVRAPAPTMLTSESRMTWSWASG